MSTHNRLRKYHELNISQCVKLEPLLFRHQVYCESLCHCKTRVSSSGEDGNSTCILFRLSRREWFAVSWGAIHTHILETRQSCNYILPLSIRLRLSNWIMLHFVRLILGSLVFDFKSLNSSHPSQLLEKEVVRQPQQLPRIKSQFERQFPGSG